MGENSIKHGTGPMFLTNADGVKFKLGDAAEAECTEVDWPKENPHLLALGRTNGRTQLTLTSAEFTCTARINKKLLHKLLHRYPYNPRRRWRNEKKAVRMMYRALYRHVKALVLAHLKEEAEKA